MVKACLDWLDPQKDDGGAYVINEMSRKELSHVMTAALKAEGQETLI